MARNANVELTREEVATLLALVQGRHSEVARIISGMQESEGMDLQRHNALKVANKQDELLTDLLLKLEGAKRDAA